MNIPGDRGPGLSLRQFLDLLDQNESPECLQESSEIGEIID